MHFVSRSRDRTATVSQGTEAALSISIANEKGSALTLALLTVVNGVMRRGKTWNVIQLQSRSGIGDCTPREAAIQTSHRSGASMCAEAPCTRERGSRATLTRV